MVHLLLRMQPGEGDEILGVFQDRGLAILHRNILDHYDRESHVRYRVESYGVQATTLDDMVREAREEASR